MLVVFLKDSVIYIVPALVSRGLALFLVPLYTRVLSPAEYGSLDLFIVFSSIVNLTIALEVSQGVARFYAAETDPQFKISYASSAFWFTIACYSIFAVLALLLTDQMAYLIMGQAGLENTFQIGIFYIWLNGLFCLIQNQFRWEMRSKYYAVISLLMSFVTAGVSVWLTYIVRWGLEGLLLGMTAGSLVGTTLGLWWLRHSFCFRFNVKRLREMLSFSIPLVLSGIAVWVSLYIDRVMINYFLSIDEVGLYSIGYRLASISGLVMVGFQGALTPLVYTYYREAETPYQLAKIFRYCLVFSLLIFLVLSLFSIDIIRLLTTEPFYGGAAVVVYLVPAILLANMYIFAPGIGISKKTHFYIWINCSGALINTVLNYFLIPFVGIVGAGMATLLSYLSVFAVYMVFSQRLYNVPHNWCSIFSVVIFAAGIAGTLPCLEVGDAVRWGLNALALVVFLAASVVFNLVNIKELKKVAVLIKVCLRLS